jgi:predicted MFS family arabinose efflux permease
MRLAINGGFAAGPAVAGLLADRSFFLLFAADAATSLVFGLIALLWLPRGAPVVERPQVRAEGARAIVADRPFLLFLLACTIMAAVYAQTATAFPLWVRGQGYSNATYGWLIALNGALIVGVELFLLSFMQRFRTTPLIVTGFLMIGAGFAATAAAHSLPLLALTVLVWTAGEMVSFPTSTVHVANISPLHLRGRYQGAWGLSWAIGWTVGPILGGRLYARNPGLLWLGCGALAVVAALLVAALPDQATARVEALIEEEARAG